MSKKVDQLFDKFLYPFEWHNHHLCPWGVPILPVITIITGLYFYIDHIGAIAIWFVGGLFLILWVSEKVGRSIGNEIGEMTAKKIDSAFKAVEKGRELGKSIDWIIGCEGTDCQSYFETLKSHGFSILYDRTINPDETYMVAVSKSKMLFYPFKLSELDQSMDDITILCMLGEIEFDNL